MPISTTQPPRALVLLPGLLCDAAVWEHQRASLSSIARCHVPSYGLVDRIEQMAEEVLATVPEDRFALVGHSMGGRVALEVLRQAPQRVERLCLLDTGYGAIEVGTKGDAERQSRHALLETARAVGMRAMGRQWARGMVHPTRLDTPLFDAVLDMIDRASVASFAAQIEALLQRPDATGLLPRITVPTLLLCGSEDTWSPPSRHQAMQSVIAGSRLTLIANAGHMTTMEQPQAVSAALAAWLQAPSA